jgi:hypothetical protein
MRFSRTFFRAAAVCSFVSVFTTLCLIFLYHFFPSAETLEARVARDSHPVYAAYLWIYFAHPFFVLTAAFAAGVKLIPRAAGAALTGFMFFFVWGFSEMLQQALTLVARHHTWSPAYTGAADDASRAAVATYLNGFGAVWDSLYALIVVAFMIANILYALASWRGAGLTRSVSWGYWAASFLSIFTVASGFGWDLETQVVSWLYPLIQPAARALIGVWLWRTGPLDICSDPHS